MWTLMLDPRFKSFHLVFSFISHNQGITIVEQYDIISLYPMFIKCYYHLHPSIEFDNDFVDQRVDDDNNLDIFQMRTQNTKPTKELVTRELLVFWRYEWIWRISNVPFSNGRNMKPKRDTSMVVENQQSLKFEIRLVRTGQKIDCFQIVENRQAWKPDFFPWKKFDTQNGSHKPSILFWNQEPTRFSHRGQKQKQKTQNQRFSKKGENRPTWYGCILWRCWFTCRQVRSPKKRHILCAHTQRGWGDPMWTVNPIVLLMRIASVLVNFQQWSLLRNQWQKCSQNSCGKNRPNLGSSLFCWL